MSRLTEALFSEFDEFIERLRVAAQRAGTEAFIDASTVEKIAEWFETLQDGLHMGRGELTAPEGEFLIYAPGSRVCARINGMLHDRVLIEPLLQIVLGTPTIYYSYEIPGEGKGHVPHDNIEPTGHEWHKVFWNPSTGAITDPDEADEFFECR